MNTEAMTRLTQLNEIIVLKTGENCYTKISSIDKNEIITGDGQHIPLTEVSCDEIYGLVAFIL